MDLAGTLARPLAEFLCPEFGISRPLESVRARWAEIDRDLLDFVASLTPEDVQRVVHHTTTAGVPQAQPLWQLLQHLANHGTYHRGQITTLLRQLGAKAIGTDLITFYRERAAQATAKA